MASDLLLLGGSLADHSLQGLFPLQKPLPVQVVLHVLRVVHFAEFLQSSSVGGLVLPFCLLSDQFGCEDLVPAARIEVVAVLVEALSQPLLPLVLNVVALAYIRHHPFRPPLSRVRARRSCFLLSGRG